MAKKFKLGKATSAIYEGFYQFKTCEVYDVRSSCVGCLGGLSDEDLAKVFDHAWSVGKPI